MAGSNYSLNWIKCLPDKVTTTRTTANPVFSHSHFSPILFGYNHLLLFFSGRSRDHFLHARACYVMKQNSPNCLLCPNESFPSKGFYLMHMHSKHNIEVDAMLCISCGISTSIFEYIPRHQIKCFQVIFRR